MSAHTSKSMFTFSLFPFFSVFPSLWISARQISLHGPAETRARNTETAAKDFIVPVKCKHSEYSPASEVRWLKPRLISCFPMADVCCDCCDAVKLFCVTNCAGPFLWLLDVDDDAADCFLWLFWCSCCCDADGGDGKFDDDSLALLWFLRNFVRKPLSGG